MQEMSPRCKPRCLAFKLYHQGVVGVCLLAFLLGWFYLGCFFKSKLRLWSLSKPLHPLNSEGISELDFAYFENQISFQFFRDLSSIFLLNANS